LFSLVIVYIKKIREKDGKPREENRSEKLRTGRKSYSKKENRRRPQKENRRRPQKENRRRPQTRQ
jgi:hypothetical protein